jgi:hypothetical protein
MTRKEAMRINYQEAALMSCGITSEHAEMLRKISMTLHRWHERECTDIDYNEETGRPHQYYPWSGKLSRLPIPDKGKGARKRLAAIMASYPHLSAYVQGDPRGCALYIIRPGDVKEGWDVESCYSNGIAVY